MRTVLAVLDHTSASANAVEAIRNPIDQLEVKATARAVARMQPAQPPAPTTPSEPVVP